MHTEKERCPSFKFRPDQINRKLDWPTHTKLHMVKSKLCFLYLYIPCVMCMSYTYVCFRAPTISKQTQQSHPSFACTISAQGWRFAIYMLILNLCFPNVSDQRYMKLYICRDIHSVRYVAICIYIK